MLLAVCNDENQFPLANVPDEKPGDTCPNHSMELAASASYIVPRNTSLNHDRGILNASQRKKESTDVHV